MYTYDAVAWDWLFLLMGIIGASELVTFFILKGFGVWHSVGIEGMESGDIFTLVSQGRLWEGLTVWRVSDRQSLAQDSVAVE